MYLPIILGLTTIFSPTPHNVAINQNPSSSTLIDFYTERNVFKIAQQPEKPSKEKEKSIKETIEIVKERIKKYQAENNIKKEVENWASLGVLYRLDGKARMGIAPLQKALEIHRRIDHPSAKSFALNLLGATYSNPE